ncbi:NAD(P)-dependent oxidoreductase [Fulvivirga lutea]|uniref:Phosphoglycerate dehydrogenase n=1 Tax=Fulvivirga lutea TaxID=2810512 RepID=A0A974WG48_9BACT|nr:NAD(P)-dependent oxidoreductase [Fulvivirga lutea]QSE96983.1 phosphoglycerate dehydrogenase [Fulvivirga lutea]
MKFLIIDEMHDSIVPLLKSIGIEPHYDPKITKEEIVQTIGNYHGLVVRSKLFIDKEILESANNLKFICRAGAGIDNLDVKEIEKRGIEIINAPEGNRNAVAEHCLGAAFSLINNIVKSDNEVRSGKWDREGNRGHELKDKNLGIIGYGYMGSAVAHKFKHLVNKVCVYDKYKTGFSQENIVEVTLDQLFEETDMLSIHVPLTEETSFMINKGFISKFKKAIWLLNTSRGEVLKLSDLIQGLHSGKILGAALDVLENEKINLLNKDQQQDFDKLRGLSNVILTPHVAGWSYESYRQINEVIVKKLKAKLDDL